MNLLELGFSQYPTLPYGTALPPATIEGNYLTLPLTKQTGVTYWAQSAGSLLHALPDSFSGLSFEYDLHSIFIRVEFLKRSHTST
jgi:hypothetical protein